MPPLKNRSERRAPPLLTSASDTPPRVYIHGLAIWAGPNGHNIVPTDVAPPLNHPLGNASGLTGTRANVLLLCEILTEPSGRKKGAGQGRVDRRGREGEGGGDATLALERGKGAGQKIKLERQSEEVHKRPGRAEGRKERWAAVSADNSVTVLPVLWRQCSTG